MDPTELNRFNELYQRHLGLLKFQGKRDKTIDAYSRAVRRISEYFAGWGRHANLLIS
jgi:integrase/recombinase XerD